MGKIRKNDKERKKIGSKQERNNTMNNQEQKYKK